MQHFAVKINDVFIYFICIHRIINENHTAIAQFQPMSMCSFAYNGYSDELSYSITLIYFIAHYMK